MWKRWNGRLVEGGEATGGGAERGGGRGCPQAGGGWGMQTPEPPGLSGELREGGRAEAPTPVDLEGPGEPSGAGASLLSLPPSLCS